MATTTLTAGDRGAYAKTLGAATVDSVVFADDVTGVRVWHDGTAAVYFTTDGTVPTAGGATTYELPAGGPAVYKVPLPAGSRPTVKLISAGTPKYSVWRI